MISFDDDPDNADWLKTTWDLPPYMSPEFMALGLDLKHFRTTPVYKAAVKAGLILDDEWVGDYVATPEPTKTQDSKRRQRPLYIHIH